MHLARFKTIAQMVKNDSTLLEVVCSTQIYRRLDNTWYDDIDKEVTDKKDCSNLDKTLSDNVSWRARSSKNVFIH